MYKMDKTILIPKSHYGRIDYLHNNPCLTNLLGKKTLNLTEVENLKKLGIKFKLELSSCYENINSLINS